MLPHERPVWILLLGPVGYQEQSRMPLARGFSIIPGTAGTAGTTEKDLGGWNESRPCTVA
jgi:hypothetical protein